MSVSLSPSSSLGFQRPFTQTVKRTLAVSNSNSQPIAFKVKTTAPKQYCVRPNSGRVEPGETVEVQVLLQAMKEDPPANAKCRDKFLVQSAVITPDRETSTLAELWSIIEKTDKASIHEQKIRCTYLPSQSATVPEEDGDVSRTSEIAPEDSAPAYATNETPSRYAAVPSSPAAASSPQTNGATPSVSITNPSEPATPPSGAATTIKEKALGAATAVGLGGVAAAAVNAAGSAGSTAQEKGGEALAAAQSTIARLEAELKSAREESAGLRRRNVPTTTAEVKQTATAVKEKVVETAEGVPVQLVVAIAVGVFVVTWCVFCWLCGGSMDGALTTGHTTGNRLFF